MIYLALFSSLIFYVFPALTGRAIYHVVKTIYENKLRKNDSIKKDKEKNLSLPFISYFILGSFTIYGALLTSYFLFPGANFKTIIQFTLGAIAFITLPANLIISTHDLNLKKYLLPIATSTIAGITAYSIWQFKSPYSLNWDLYEHQTLVNNIFLGKFSVLTSQITDTFGFNGYTTFFHSLIAGSQSFINTNILEYWSVLSLTHFTLVIFASFVLTKVITNNKTLSVFTAITTALIFDSSMSFSTLFIIPQTFTAVIFILLFSQLISEIKKKTLPPFWLVALGSIFLISNHFIVGAVTVGIYLFTYFYFRFPHILRKREDKLYVFIAVLLTGIATIFASTFISLDSLNQGEAQAFSLSFTDKFNAMKQSYGYILLFIPLGIYVILKKKDEIFNLILFITAALMTIILLDLPYVLKFFVIERYFIQLILVIGIFEIIRRIGLVPLRYISYFLTIAAFFVIFIINSSIWKSGLYYKNTLSHISSYEIRGAQFLNKNYDMDTIIISDPATQHALEPISMLNTQGGAYMSKESRKKLILANNATTTNAVAQLIRSINDDLTDEPNRRLLILSERYFSWQNSTEKDRLSLAYNVWAPRDLTFENKFKIYDFIADKKNFKVVFANPAMYIFEVIN